MDKILIEERKKFEARQKRAEITREQSQEKIKEDIEEGKQTVFT